MSIKASIASFVNSVLTAIGGFLSGRPESVIQAWPFQGKMEMQHAVVTAKDLNNGIAKIYHSHYCLVVPVTILDAQGHMVLPTDMIYVDKGVVFIDFSSLATPDMKFDVFVGPAAYGVLTTVECVPSEDGAFHRIEVDHV